jgi:hypothetical protein
MFKRSLLLSVVMFGLVNAADAPVVVEAAAAVAETTAEVTTEAGKEAAGLLSQAYDVVKAGAVFAVAMVNPMEVYATVSDLAKDLYGYKAEGSEVIVGGLQVAGTNLWTNHKPTIALAAVVTTLAALEAYDNLISKAWKKAKEAVNN